MDGRWMDGQMDGWMDGWTDGWMDRWMDRLTDGLMEGWMDGHTIKKTLYGWKRKVAKFIFGFQSFN